MSCEHWTVFSVFGKFAAWAKPPCRAARCGQQCLLGRAGFGGAPVTVPGARAPNLMAEGWPLLAMHRTGSWKPLEVPKKLAESWTCLLHSQEGDENTGLWVMATKRSSWNKHQSLTRGERGAWLFPDSDPLNSDENELEVNKMKCSLYARQKNLILGPAYLVALYSLTTGGRQRY